MNWRATRAPDSSSEVQGIHIAAANRSLPKRLIVSVRKSRSDRRVSANASQCAERIAETAVKGVIQVANAFAVPELVDSERIAAHCQELLRRTAVADMRAREAFAVSGDITEANMERLVEYLLGEEGQANEDYQQRATMFYKIAEFFSQGRAYSPPTEEEFWTGAAEIASIVDVVLAGEGRSATDYNCRAQLFAKSAEVFPFRTEVRSN